MSAFDTLRDAAKHQRGESQDPPRADRRGAQLDLHLERATSHPGIACAVEAIAAAPVVPPHERKKREQSPRNAAPLAQDSKGQTAIEIEPVVEPQSLSGDRPFWAHAADAVVSRPESRALVPVVIDARSGEIEDQFDASRAFSAGGRRGATPFSFGFRLDVSRPRMLLALLGVLALGVMANNLSTRYSGGGIADAQAQQRRVATVADSLKLLEPGTVAAKGSAAPATRTPATLHPGAPAAAVVAVDRAQPLADDPVNPDARRAPSDINDYVKWALPQVNPEGTRRANATTGPVADRGERALPRVELGARAKSAARPKHSALPPKKPVPDRIEPLESTRPIASSASAPAVAPRSAASPTGVDLNTVYIEASLTRDEMPYRVGRIADQEGGRGAYIVPKDEGNDAAGVWAQAGTSFPNGWELVGVEGNEAIFLKKDGRSVRVPVSQ